MNRIGMERGEMIKASFKTMGCTTLLYWCFHIMDHGPGILLFVQQWWLCLLLSLVSTVIVLSIFRLGRL